MNKKCESQNYEIRATTVYFAVDFIDLLLILFFREWFIFNVTFHLQHRCVQYRVGYNFSFNVIKSFLIHYI